VYFNASSEDMEDVKVPENILSSDQLKRLLKMTGRDDSNFKFDKHFKASVNGFDNTGPYFDLMTGKSQYAIVIKTDEG